MLKKIDNSFFRVEHTDLHIFAVEYNGLHDEFRNTAEITVSALNPDFWELVKALTKEISDFEPENKTISSTTAKLISQIDKLLSLL